MRGEAGAATLLSLSGPVPIVEMAESLKMIQLLPGHREVPALATHSLCGDVNHPCEAQSV